MLKIDELTTARGELSPVYLRHEAGVTAIVAEAEGWILPDGAVAAVLRRFGGPLDPGERLGVVASLDLGVDGTLRHVRHLSGYDVVARDYLLYERPGEETLCCLAVTVAGALTHLGRAAGRAAANQVFSNTSI